MSMIDISKTNKADVLACLYNNSKPQGLGFLHYEDKDMSREEANRLLEARGDYKFFDYVKGRVIKVNLSKDEFSPSMYDRDNGEGAAKCAIAHLL